MSAAEEINPISGLTREQQDAVFYPMYDNFVENLLTTCQEDKWLPLHERLEPQDAFSPIEGLSLILREEIPRCCAGHTHDALQGIMNMFAMTNEVCTMTDCPEQLNHEFMTLCTDRFTKFCREIELSLNHSN